MGDWPAKYQTPLFIHSISLWASEADINAGVAISGSTAAWPTANLRLYVPFSLPWPYPVKRVFWANGSSAGSNWDFALHSIGGSLIYATGSTAGSGNTTSQFVTPSSMLLLPPGRYYMSLVCDATTANRVFLPTITVIDARMRGLLQEASAFTAPATMTGAQYAQTGIPLCGITKTASGF